jgi:hypothetical protein
MAVPQSVRWVLFLPLGVGCSLLAVSVLEACFDAAGLPRVHAFTPRAAASRFVAGFTFTWFPAVLSPRPWLVGVLMFAIGVAVELAPVAYGFLAVPYIRARLVAAGVHVALQAIAVSALGGCLALLLVRRSGRGPAVIDS